MHPNFADGLLQVGVGLTQMAVTSCQHWLFCSGTLCDSVAEAGFLLALDKDQANMFTRSLQGRRSCSCTDTLRTTCY